MEASKMKFHVYGKKPNKIRERPDKEDSRLMVNSTVDVCLFLN